MHIVPVLWKGKCLVWLHLQKQVNKRAELNRLFAESESVQGCVCAGVCVCGHVCVCVSVWLQQASAYLCG